MKHFFVFLGMAISFSALSANASPLQTSKMSCMMVTGSMEETKKNLLLQAKREASSELFGELITSYSAVQDFELTQDTITSSSAGYVRVEGSPTYSNGQNLGEICVAINAYVTEEDLNKFKAINISNKQCISDGTLTLNKIKTYAEEQVVTAALINYSRKLEGKSSQELLKLVHEINYTESGLIPDTSTYCARFTGKVYPVEIEASLLKSSGNAKAQDTVPDIASDTTFSQVYTGILDQPGFGTFPIVITRAGDNWSFDYPSFPCGGSLIPEGSTDGTVSTFKEEYSYNKNRGCETGGKLILQKVASGFYAQWVSSKGLTGAAGDIDLSGQSEWRGTYLCAQGTTNLSLSMKTLSDGNIEAEFFFYPTTKASGSKWGKFTLSGHEQGDTLELSPKEWKKQPAGYSMVPMSGAFNKERTSFSGRILFQGCTAFNLTKVH